MSYNYDIRPILSDKCFACHGPDENKREAGLRLDIEEIAKAELTESKGLFAIVANDAENSQLIKRVRTDQAELVMPPPELNQKLTEAEIETLAKWIDQGAKYEQHWAFSPPQKATSPAVKKKNWVQNDIDLFTLAKMEEQGFNPNPQATRSQLLKRIAFDLTGLPPTAEILEGYDGQSDDDAIDWLITELMKSPHYGEQMAVPWLDAARYADSHGYQDDGLRTMWPWRDWVIHAFNQNYSYKKFASMQLAGDLFPNANKEDLLATGFNRNHKITQEGGVIDEEYRIEYVTDRTNTFAKTFLGLTFECSKCHDHKFDPISQKEYFEAFAFFDQVPEKGLYGTIDASFADPPNMEITDEDINDILNFVNKIDTGKLEVMVMKDSANMRTTHVLNRGNYDDKGEIVIPSMPEVILPYDQSFEQNRIGLVQWLFDEANPLTARVIVNRIWKQFMGSALVASEGDFGMQGKLPSHPALLDWLAVEFVANDWDFQWLIRTIMTSATYQQSSKIDIKKEQLDPENRYYSRMNRVRLSAENIRDHVLASSGLLVPDIGGESVKPYQPDGLWDAATSGRGTLTEYQQDTGQALYRRGMYTFIKRTVPPPVMLTFDSSPRDQCEVRRLKTNTPLQALVMLNDPTVLEASRHLAEKTVLNNNTSVDEKISDLSNRILCRPPSDKEFKHYKSYLSDLQSTFESKPESAHQIIQAGEKKPLGNMNPVEVASWMQLIHLMYNLEETIVKV